MPRVLIYKTTPETEGDRLGEMLHTLDPKADQEVCTSIEALLEKLRRPVKEELILVLAPADGKDLATLLYARRWMMDRRIILVLPDAREKTISDGHVLRPRFLSYADGDFADVAAVMKKMIDNSIHKPIIPNDSRSIDEGGLF